MKIDKSKIKKILFITLSNIGDIILTTPAMKVLSENFPDARIDVLVGPSGVELFKKHPAVYKAIEYNKHIPMQEKRRLVRKLRMVKYDLIVDMRNTLLPFLVGAKYRTNPVKIAPKTVKHKKQQHLWKLSSLGLSVSNIPFDVYIPQEDDYYINGIMKDINKSSPLIAISPGAKSEIKRWPKGSYTELINLLTEHLNAKVVMIGDKLDSILVKEIITSQEGDIMDLSGRTTLSQLASCLKRCDLLITNDSAPLHIAGAVDTKVLAIFGPTDPEAYGPTGKEDRILRKRLHCSPCGKAQCEFEHECMRHITADEVFKTAKEMLDK
jgi:lipopolysaccharide heptosyltransferase II